MGVLDAAAVRYDRRMTSTPAPHDPLAALAARVREMRWLKPDAGTESLSAEAREQIMDRVTEHLATLCALGKREAPTRPVVHFTRSMTDANTRWEARWSEAIAPEALWHVAMLDAVRENVEARIAETGGNPTQRVEALLGAALQANRPPVPVVPPSYSGAIRSQRGAPALHTLLAHGLYLAVHPEPAEAALSPWAPLIELWALGVWPMILPDGEFLIYVPVQDALGVVPDADRASVREIPRRAPIGAKKSGAIPALHVLGVGPGPCVFPQPPPSVPGVLAAAFGPPRVIPRPMGGAPPPVKPGPLPVRPQDPFAGAPKWPVPTPGVPPRPKGDGS